MHPPPPLTAARATDILRGKEVAVVVTAVKRLAIVSALVVYAGGASYPADNLLVNSDFSSGLHGWELYGKDKEQIRLGEGIGPEGSNCAVVPVGHCSIAETMGLRARKLYELSFLYRRTSPSSRGGLVFFLNRTGGANASAGVINLTFPRDWGDALPSGWEEFREAFRAPSGTTRGKVVLSARGSGELTYAHVELKELPLGSEPDGLLPGADWSRLATSRTRNPVFEELLSDSAGGHTVIAWTHNMNRANLPPSMADKYTNEQWKEEQVNMYREAGEVGMHHYSLPWQGEVADEMHRRFGMKFDVNCESSGVRANAIKAGAEILNPIRSSTTSIRPSVSLVDPVYVSTAVEELKRYAQRFLGKPYVFAYVGKDEPSIAIPEGPVAEWGPFGKRCTEEVLRDYGFGRYGIPAPDDPEYLQDEANRPFRWTAFNRWMAAKYAESKRQVYEELKAIDPGARYNPCDYWFMTGFVPYDFALMGRYSDIVECDPYASSAERMKGRGLYNHGFGPKLLGDITGKPVRSIVQAFDYAGYNMTPDDLLEWVSQSLRAGASHISYYQNDNPRFTHPDRWKMMMHISKLVTGMKVLKRPNDPETAVLYSADSHRSQGPSTKANEIYTAYSLLGERVGSWFDFVDDDSLDRGEKSLSKYRIVYIPLGTYQRQSVARQIEKFVKDGGTVICGDPTVFSWDIDGTDLSSWREGIFGVRTVGPKTPKAMLVKKSEWTDGLPVGQMLPIYRPVGRDGWLEENGWSVELVRPGVRVLATFLDGSPAMTVLKYGKGQAVYFAANPFVPECLFAGDRWDGVLRAFQQHLGAKVDRPIWRFRLPPPD